MNRCADWSAISEQPVDDLESWAHPAPLPLTRCKRIVGICSSSHAHVKLCDSVVSRRVNTTTVVIPFCDTLFFLELVFLKHPLDALFQGPQEQ